MKVALDCWAWWLNQNFWWHVVAVFVAACLLSKALIFLGKRLGGASSRGFWVTARFVSYVGGWVLITVLTPLPPEAQIPVVLAAYVNAFVFQALFFDSREPYRSMELELEEVRRKRMDSGGR